MRTKLCVLIFAALLVTSAGCVGYESKAYILVEPKNQTEPMRGVYLVNRWSLNKEDLDPLQPNEHLVVYDESKFFGEGSEPTKYIALHKTEFIPFELKRQPKGIPQQDGRLNLDLQFSDSTAKDIENFTRKYVGRQVAMVVDGEIITLHKLRSVIKGGAVQISRCTDNGCEIILAKLKPQDK